MKNKNKYNRIYNLGWIVGGLSLALMGLAMIMIQHYIASGVYYLGATHCLYIATKDE